MEKNIRAIRNTARRNKSVDSLKQAFIEVLIKSNILILTDSVGDSLGEIAKIASLNYEKERISLRRLRGTRRRIYALDTRYEIAINNFIEEIIKNSENNVLTIETIDITMKGICPCWPFC